MAILSGCVIAITGVLPHEPCNIKQWVEANGGKWSARVIPQITHLICSKDAWKNVTDPVMLAAELQKFIVSYDWLEDSLQGKRKLAEKRYTWEQIQADRKRRRELKKLGKLVDGKKFIEGCKQIKELTGSGTSKKLPHLRKRKPSKGLFFTPTITTPYVSSLDVLKQMRAEREAVLAAKKAKKAARQAVLKSSGGSHDTPIDLEDMHSTSGSLPTPPASLPSASPTKPTPLPASSITPAVKPQAKNPTLKDLYHYYLDVTGFEYKITLVRSDFSTNNITRYQLSILESHVVPHTYCTFIQYTPPPLHRPADPPADTPPITNLRNPLLNFINSAPPPSAPAASQDFAAHEAARLLALSKPPVPTPTAPYRTLIMPIGSPFHLAWRAFRHAFRDLTHLSWEERFDANKPIQISRAKVLGIEPYIYAKPARGMPVGLMPQDPGLVQIAGDEEDGYVRNEWGLPGADEVLGTGGVIGSAIRREEEGKRMEEERVRKEGVMKLKRMNYRAPMFNGVTGRPR